MKNAARFNCTVVLYQSRTRKMSNALFETMLDTYSINSTDCKEDETKRKKKEETVFSGHLLSLLLNTSRCHLNLCHKMTFYLFHVIAERQWQVLYKYRKIVWKKKKKIE